MRSFVTTVVEWLAGILRARSHHIHDWKVTAVRLLADGIDHEVDAVCDCGMTATAYGNGGTWRSAATGTEVGPGVALLCSDAVSFERRKQRIAAAAEILMKRQAR